MSIAIEPISAESKKQKKYGSKEEVFNGEALCTTGGLKKEDLILNNKNKIVSKKRSEHGKKMQHNLRPRKRKDEQEIEYEISDQEDNNNNKNIEIEPEALQEVKNEIEHDPKHSKELSDKLGDVIQKSKAKKKSSNQ